MYLVPKDKVGRVLDRRNSPLGYVFGALRGAVIALIIGGAGAGIPEVSMPAGLFKPRVVGAFVPSILVVATAGGFVFAFTA